MQRVGMGGLESVGPTEPHLIVTAGGGIGYCKLALMDGIVCHLLSIVDAAKKLMSFGIVWLCSEYLTKAGGCFIDPPLLKKIVGLSRVSQEKANAEEEKKRKGKAHAGQRGRNKHD